jgi:hypothetical protein
MKKDQKKHYDQIARMGCSLCRFVLGYPDTPCEIHHIRRAGKRDSAPVIGLCPYHHRGNGGIHGMGRKAFEREYKITEEELLEKTLEKLNNEKLKQSNFIRHD